MSVRASSILVILAVFYLAGCGNADRQGKDVADAFLGDIRAGAWNAAFSRMHVGMQSACGSVGDFRRRVESDALVPASWTVKKSRVSGNGGLLEIMFTGREGTERYAGLELEKADGELRIRNWQTGGMSLCREEE